MIENGSASIVCTGIDPSLSGTAICSGVDDRERSIERYPTKKLGDFVTHRIERCETIMEQMVPHLVLHRPKLIFIEGYSMGSSNGREYAGELGMMIRWHCKDYTPHIFEVAPSTLKKFITGSGASSVSKSDVKMGVLKRWNREFHGTPGEDLADAFSLYQMARAAIGAAPMTNSSQRDSIATVIKGRESEIQSLASRLAPAF